MSEKDSNPAESEANAAPGAEDPALENGEQMANEAPADGETAEPVGEPSLEELVSTLQEDVLAARDAALRAQADAQNVKRRSEQDVEKARKFALERFSGDLLPVVDNLERSLEAASGSDELSKSISEGVELTLKSLNDVLKKYNIEAIDPRGRALRSAAASGHDHGGKSRFGAQYSDGRDAKGLQPQWQTVASGHGDGE